MTNTIRIGEIQMMGTDAVGRYAMAEDSSGELVGVSFAGDDEAIRDLSEIEPGDTVEVGGEEYEVVA